MALKDEVEQLRRVPLFADIPPAKLKLLAFTSDIVKFPADKVLFVQGEVGDAAYVLLSGTVDILIETSGGQMKVNSFGANSIVGEIAILCDAQRTATVKTTEPVTALRIQKDHFLKMLADSPEMMVQIIKVLAERLSQTTAVLTEARTELRKLS